MSPRLRSMLLPLILATASIVNVQATPVPLIPQKRGDTLTSACREFVLLEQSFLEAVCLPAPGESEIQSVVNLDFCVSEQNGDLVAGGGGFLGPGTCDPTSVSLDLVTVVLSAKCTSISGFTIGSELPLAMYIPSSSWSLAQGSSIISLDQAVVSVNGVLQCA
ncbi:hypothetical protein FB45DRAFT_872193 [Roridomyces roridus]|uniref:Cyanovirin-N domain-containing protein n=1 Tax=Roridomyces roridus TaxID=1738132 RepID=A0AAD7BD51_9AGAR|nr:hypothetical protein FB45DRAFT_872193 [Roridomyces roridus]